MRIIAILLALSLGGPGATVAWTQTTDAEVGGTRTMPDGIASIGLPDLRTGLQLRLGADAFLDEEIRESYGLLGGAELGVVLNMNLRTSFFTTAGYFRSHGDPYFDDPYFSNPEGLLVTSIPLLFGMKFNIADPPGFRLYLGAGMGPNWVTERIPTVQSGGQDQNIEASGLLVGWRYFIGPEFDLGGGAVGVELGFGGVHGQLSEGTHHHDIDLGAFQPRVTYTLMWR